MNPSHTLPQLLSRTLSLLTRIQPHHREGDKQWKGLFFASKPSEWHSIQFLLYEREFFATMEMGWSSVTLEWTVGTSRVRFEGSTPFSSYENNDAVLWARVLLQAERQLRRALKNPEAFHRWLERRLPLRSRVGRLRRWLSWPTSSKPPLTSSQMRRLESAWKQGIAARGLRSLSLRQYLDITAIAYDAAFPKLRRLSARQKFESKADRRHGGMLDLPASGARAFLRWYHSRAWLGAHPFEIVFAHPDGVLLSPFLRKGRWRFSLSAEHLGQYVMLARMATALGENRIPFELSRPEELLAALRGEDWVEIGPYFDQLSLAELRTRRRGAVGLVEWEPIPRIAPISSKTLSASKKEKV